MASPAREYSLHHYLLERMKFSGLQEENLNDLISIVVSLKNKYGMTPFAAVPHGQPVPDGLTARYVIQAITLPKLTSIVHDTPRLNSMTISPRGIPAATEFEVGITLGG